MIIKTVGIKKYDSRVAEEPLIQKGDSPGAHEALIQKCDSRVAQEPLIHAGRRYLGPVSMQSIAVELCSSPRNAF